MKPKTLLVVLFTFIAISLPANAAAETNGFLVFEVGRYNYDATGHAGGTEIKQKFKVPLTEELMSNFKRVTSQNGMGTELYCAGGNLANSLGGTRFVWWIHKTADGHWVMRTWAMGFETIKGIHINSENPNVTQCVTIRKLEDLDMSYMISCVNMPDGMNISFGAKYVSAIDVKAEESIPTAPVKRANGSDLFIGDIATNCPIMFRCAFQED